MLTASAAMTSCLQKAKPKRWDAWLIFEGNFDIYESTCSPLAEKVLTWIAELYRIERNISGKPAEQRKAVRQKKARPIFEAFSDWLITRRPTLPK